jgi:hypothetical protein
MHSINADQQNVSHSFAVTVAATLIVRHGRKREQRSQHKRRRKPSKQMHEGSSLDFLLVVRGNVSGTMTFFGKRKVN